MSLKLRIRTELDKSPSGDDFDGVLETIITEGVSEEELREILPEVIKQVARTRVAAPLMAPRRDIVVPAPLPPTPALPRADDKINKPVTENSLMVSTRLNTVSYKPQTQRAPIEKAPTAYPVTASTLTAPVRPAPAKVKETPVYGNSTPELLPKAKQVFRPSAKVQAYQSSRLEELYPVGSGKYKKLKEMNREDIRFNVRMLEGRIKGIEGRVKGWNKVLDQLISYKVNVVQELPNDVKEKI